MEVFTEKATPRLDSVERTLRSLYSNGSGGPPGYLETARAEDNKRFEQLFKFADQAHENGETFKDFIRSYIAEREVRKQSRVRMLSTAKVILPVVGSIVLGTITLIWKSASPVVMDVVQQYHVHIQQEAQKPEK